MFRDLGLAGMEDSGLGLVAEDSCLKGWGWGLESLGRQLGLLLSIQKP